MMWRKHAQTVFLLIIFLLGFIVRLYRFNNPVADWHSWRQADTSSVSRNFIKYGFDLLHPRMNNISNVQSGLENPKGYFYVEFPLYNGLQAGLFVLFGHLTLEEWGRLISMCTSLLGAYFLFLLVEKRGYTKAAWFVLAFSLFLPFTIYYSRTILPDTSMVAFILGGIYFLDRWIDTKVHKVKKQYAFLFLATIFTAVALLLKPYAAFYGLPMLVLAFTAFKWRLFLRWELWVFAVFSVVPLALWRVYMLSYPEGIPANAWLFNGNGIRFRPAFFRWIFYERLTKLISGFFNAVFLALGTLGIWKEKKDRWFFLSFGISSLLYLCIIATGNVQHDYYQIVIMPFVALFMGFGAVWVGEWLRKYLKETFAYAIVIVLMLLGLFISWQQIKYYFDINNWAIVAAGKAVDQLTPKNAKVLAPYDGDSSFLYQTNRQGWASFEHDLPTLIHMGADYLVLVNPKPTDFGLAKQYKLISSSKEYLLFDLHQKL